MVVPFPLARILLQTKWKYLFTKVSQVSDKPITAERGIFSSFPPNGRPPISLQSHSIKYSQ